MTDNADQQGSGTALPSPDNCPFTWCDHGPNLSPGDHWELNYVTASLGLGQLSRAKGWMPVNVGAGVKYVENEMPAVIVHIEGGFREVDEDAHLRISEAVALRDNLTVAIHRAREALQHLFDAVDTEEKGGG